MSGMWTPSGKGGGDLLVAIGIGMIVVLVAGIFLAERLGS